MLQGRRILRIDGAKLSVAHEARFESEARLHDAIAAHPEILPHEDFGLDPLVPIARELNVGGHFLDLLLVDQLGRLAIVEFKRGTENPDVRQVVAQILEYGASLWRLDYESLEAQCREAAPGFQGTLAEHVAEHLSGPDESFSVDAFRSGVESSLDSGAFVFIYCARDLDDRTRRIMTYLAEGPRMSFFAVEFDYYTEGTDGSAVLVPRTSFVPSWVAGPATSGARGSQPTVLEPPPEFYELVSRMDELARKLHLQVIKRTTGWNYLPAKLEEGIEWATSGVGIYGSSRGFEINLSILRQLGRTELADQILSRLEQLTGTSRGRDWPSVPCASVLAAWDRVCKEIIEPYFQVRGT